MQGGMWHRNAMLLINTTKYFQTPQPDKTEQLIILEYRSGAGRIKNFIKNSSTSWLTIAGRSQIQFFTFTFTQSWKPHTPNCWSSWSHFTKARKLPRMKRKMICHLWWKNNEVASVTNSIPNRPSCSNKIMSPKTIMKLKKISCFQNHIILHSTNKASITSLSTQTFLELF